MADLLAYALCTVADVKELLGIDAGNTSKDNLIKRKINWATELIEGYTQRRFKETTYTNEEYDGTGLNELLLRNRPVISITTLQSRDTAQNQDNFTTIDTEDYFVDLSAGIITGIGSFYGGNARWRVTYVAGYEGDSWPDNLPWDLREACATLAAYATNNPTGAGAGTGIKRQKEGQREIEYQGNSQMSSNSLVEQLGLDDVLDRYRAPILSGLR